MEWVFDTSITMAWCFADERAARTESLLESLGGHPGTLVAGLGDAYWRAVGHE